MGRFKVTPHSCARIARVALLCISAIAGIACASDEPAGAAPVTPVVNQPGVMQPIMGAAGNGAPLMPGMT
ncbi:MAG TPA: hypothetical protein VK524_00230, partial [Polyangiaceae bacterium]|nr:hypothetical protein [Polyangiaceae bacterium]